MTFPRCECGHPLDRHYGEMDDDNGTAGNPCRDCRCVGGVVWLTVDRMADEGWFLLPNDDWWEKHGPNYVDGRMRALPGDREAWEAR